MSIKAYKGFNKDMTCRGFQYKEGETYHTDEAKLCESGFHACLDPLDCFSYYSPAESVFHEVEIDGVAEEKSGDSKICGKTLKVGAALDVAGIVKAKIDLVFKNVKKASSATGYCGASSATGYKGASSANDPCAVAVAWGYHGKAKGVLGSYIVLAEWEGNEENYWTQTEWRLKGAKMHKVDGKTIKPDTWYTLKGGKFVEITDDEARD